MSDNRGASAFRDRIARLLDPAAVGVWLGDLHGQARFSHQPSGTHRAASTMKLPLAVAFLQLAEISALDLSRLVRVHNDFLSAVPGYRFGVALEDEELHRR
jgi:beta-lactamase class A